MSGPTFERLEEQRAAWPEIPDVLRGLWRGCQRHGEGAEVARALTANFLGVATAGRDDALRHATDRLQSRTPCRAFLLVLDDAAKERTAALSATTRCQGSYRDIVLEEIAVRLPRKDLARAPGLIRPLLIDDLPSHLWWAPPWPADEAEFDKLAALCGHAIVDSKGFGNPARELAVLAERRRRGQRITDLAWLRVRPWRRALAEAFERFAWRPGTAVEGVVRHGRQATSAAILLADWLHERLAASLTIEPVADGGGAGPEHVALRLPGVDVEVRLQDQRLVVHVTTEQHCHLPFAVAASRGSDGDLLAAAIDAA